MLWKFLQIKYTTQIRKLYFSFFLSLFNNIKNPVQPQFQSNIKNVLKILISKPSKKFAFSIVSKVSYRIENSPENIFQWKISQKLSKPFRPFSLISTSFVKLLFQQNSKKFLKRLIGVWKKKSMDSSQRNINRIMRQRRRLTIWHDKLAVGTGVHQLSTF